MTQPTNDFNEEPMITAEEQQIIDSARDELRYSHIKRKWGIDQDLMQKLESEYYGITEEAAVPSKNPNEYQNALHQLLNLVSQTLELNKEKLPFQYPDLAPKLPLRTALLMYPEFEKEFKKTPEEKAKDLKDAMMEIALANEPSERKKNEAKKAYNEKFWDREERALNNPEKADEIHAEYIEDPSDVITSVKEDLQSLLGPKNDDIEVEIDETDFINEEDDDSHVITSTKKAA